MCLRSGHKFYRLALFQLALYLRTYYSGHIMVMFGRGFLLNRPGVENPNPFLFTGMTSVKAKALVKTIFLILLNISQYIHRLLK